MEKEYVPFEPYGLLRRIVGKGLQRVRREKFEEDDSAIYLVSRGLAAPNSSGSRIQSTEAGSKVGLIDWQPS